MNLCILQPAMHTGAGSTPPNYLTLTPPSLPAEALSPLTSCGTPSLQESDIGMDSMTMVARKALYAFPWLISTMPGGADWAAC